MIIFSNLLFWVSLISAVAGFTLLLVSRERFKLDGPFSAIEAYRLQLTAVAFWAASYALLAIAYLILRFMPGGQA